MSNRSMETEDELLREMTAFWGGVHSRFEWLLDTQAHFYHHLGTACRAGTCTETRAKCEMV
ncbi:hypothetical protein [Paenibacillus sp. FSL E2-0151]|uniref:hypothetical protein n=1 Tax=Paenibacillus sp. FSL E2-0151 TaxID=2921357 RepID=UPI0030EC1A65